MDRSEAGGLGTRESAAEPLGRTAATRAGGQVISETIGSCRITAEFSRGVYEHELAICNEFAGLGLIGRLPVPDPRREYVLAEPVDVTPAASQGAK